MKRISPTYEIKVYITKKDFDKRKGDLIEENIPTKTEALKIGNKEYKTGFYAVVKVQSSDREFIQCFPDKNKPKFDERAMMLLVMSDTKFQKLFEAEGFKYEPSMFASIFRHGNLNFNAKNALKKVFKESVLTNMKWCNQYKVFLKEEGERNKAKIQEFSIEIKGAGKKEDVKAELQRIIEFIDSVPLENLQEGTEDEMPNLQWSTDSAGEYV